MILDKVKKALRITTNVFDDELTDLIAAGLSDLDIAGVDDDIKADDPLITRAIITYCKANFGTPSERDYDRLKASYDEQKAQLSNASGYTRWKK